MTLNARFIYDDNDKEDDDMRTL